MPKHVVVPYVENTLYSTNKYSCVRPVHTLYGSYCIEHNGDDEPKDYHGANVAVSSESSEFVEIGYLEDFLISPFKFQQPFVWYSLVYL